MKPKRRAPRAQAELVLFGLACLAAGGFLGAAAVAPGGARALAYVLVGSAALAAALIPARKLSRFPKSSMDWLRSRIEACLADRGEPDAAAGRGRSRFSRRRDREELELSPLLARVREDRKWITAQKEFVRMETERDLEAAHRREELKRNLDASVRSRLASVDATLEEVRSASALLMKAAEGTRATGGEVEAAVGAASDSLDTVRSALRDLRASAEQIGREMTRTSEISESAVFAIVDTARSVEDLGASAVRIGEIVGLIDEIAERTNLLALNAAIEAARAGSAGRGFAVVAGEVKKLASQTGKATLDIKTLIEEVQTGTRRARDSSSETKDAVDRLDEVISGVAAAVTSQEGAVERVEGSSASLSSANSQVLSSTGGLAERVGATETMAVRMKQIAEQIAREQSGLRKEIDEFLAFIAQKTSQDAKSLTIQAAEFIKKQGLEAAEQAFLKEGRFRFGDIYACVVDGEGRWVIYPPKPENKGESIMGIVDPDGRRIGELLLGAGRLGGGWTEYKWNNPLTGRIQEKLTYVKPVSGTDLIVYVGIYL